MLGAVLSLSVRLSFMTKSVRECLAATMQVSLWEDEEHLLNGHHPDGVKYEKPNISQFNSNPLTNRSAAFPFNADLGAAVASVAETILSGDACGAEMMFVESVSRKGFRDTGRGGGISRGEVWPEAPPGDTARLRKGLFDERFNVSPWERESKA